ncbi:hypothetical protein AwWohl_10270 [Gammaproteobacteria bacterium]|nr:hypothetical protein AwWohl_10270 [Gammaproteobacteria bacterium]
MDGKAGTGTTNAIKAFQNAHQLKEDGDLHLNADKVGLSLAKLNEKTIIKFQEMLIKQGIFSDAPTGQMGPKTRKALSDYRKSKDVSASSQMDISTLLLLLGDKQSDKQGDKYGVNMVKSFEKMNYTKCE